MKQEKSTLNLQRNAYFNTMLLRYPSLWGLKLPGNYVNQILFCVSYDMRDYIIL